VMREKDRLCSLKMCVPGQNRLSAFSREANQGALERCDPAADFVGLVPKVQPQVKSDLIVSTSSGVQFPAGGPNPRRQRRLDVHMNIFQIDPEREPALVDFLSDGLQARLNLLPFYRSEQPGLFQCRSVSDRPLDIDLVESPIK